MFKLKMQNQTHDRVNRKERGKKKNFPPNRVTDERGGRSPVHTKKLGEKAQIKWTEPIKTVPY